MADIASVRRLSTDHIPELAEISSLEALSYVGQLIEHLIRHWELTETKNQVASPRNSISITENDQLVKKVTPDTQDSVRSTPALSPVEENDQKNGASDSDCSTDSLEINPVYRKFWLKKVPPIGIDAYLNRFQRYCPSSAATYLTAGALIYSTSVVLKTFPISRRNAYRLFSAAFIVSAKLVEDKLYSMNRYATTAGLSKVDLAHLEILLLDIVEFRISDDRYFLIEQLQKWAQLLENGVTHSGKV